MGSFLGLLVLLAPAAKESGTITGTVVDARAVTAVSAVDRSGEKDRRYKGTLDAKKGTFAIANLPLDANYDVVLDFGTARLEGVNLKVPPSDFAEEQPLTKDDAAAITKVCKALNKFENEVDVLAVVGNAQHAAAVLHKRRTMPFFESKPGEMVWRLEVWRFEKPDEAWLKSQDELGVVLYRQRIQKADFAKKSLTLDAKLGGVRLTAKEKAADVGKVAAPDGKPGIKLRK
jgi:hypothetical protein